MDELEAVLAKDEDVASWSTYIGQGAIRFYLPLDVQLPNPFFSQFVVIAKDVEARERLQTRLEGLLAEEFPEAVGRVSPLELGPPVGWPVSYRVSGEDATQVREIARQVAELMAPTTSPAAHQLRLDGAGARGAHRDQPGPGAAAGPEHRCGRRGDQRGRSPA